MTAIIDNLQPHQTALLFIALNRFKECAEAQHATALLNGHDSSVKLLSSYTLEQTKELIQTLFADTHIEEIDYIKHFNKVYPELLEASNQYSKTA